jgi:DNA-directed RNA polymerase specialized sigma24 family protein
MRGPTVDERTEIENAIRAALEAQDYQRAATRALEAYGHEILTFLFARLRAVTDGQEAFSMFVEDYWKSLPSFAGRCSMRVWMYTLARNAGIRHSGAAHRRRELDLTPALRDSLSALIDRVRSETQVHLRTNVKDKLRTFREQLDPDEQLLLTLHVDRALPFRDVALIMRTDGERLEPQALEREAVRLRKRFERIKAALREHARREGLIET